MTTYWEGYHFLASMLDAGHHVVLFNYRGVGMEGKATLQSVCDDAIVAAFFALQVISHLMNGGWGLPPANQKIDENALSKLIVLGYSMGGFIAPNVAAYWFGKSKSEGGVLALMDTGYDLYASLIRQAWYVRFFVPFWLLSPRMNNLALVASRYPRLKFLAHGALDDVLYDDVDETTGKPKKSFGFPVGDGQALLRAAWGIEGRDKRFFLLPRSSHKWMDQTDPQAFGAFLRALHAAVNS
jgi:pimeloyl-ACP methyl ester carboxylesterase